MNISALWDTLVDAICRPPRDKYQTGELIGGRRGYCKLAGKTIVREDLVLVNKRGQKLECSHYKPSGATSEHALPIVVYCHCNSGSRRDAEEAFYVLLPHNITVFCLDFAGSGLSDGGWVTLGAKEVDDLDVAVSHLRASYPNSTIGIWGRSMGAVTALLYSARDPSIAGVVMDSPFARLTELMVELVDEQKLPIPKPFMKVALSMMRRSVKKRAGFDIDSVAPLDIVPQCFIPALFGHATEDTFVAKGHSQRLHDAYAGCDKSFVTFKGDHNSVRPQSFYSSVLMFLHVALHCSPELASLPLGKTRPDTIRAVSAVTTAALDETGIKESSSDTDTPTKLDWVSPRRELAPPWNREQARTYTEQQMEMFRGLARTTSGVSMSTPTSGDAGLSRVASEDCPASPETLWLESQRRPDPPGSNERAPWLAVDPTPSPSARSVDRNGGGGAELPQREGLRRGGSQDGAESISQPGTAGAASIGSQQREACGAMGLEDRFWHLQPGTAMSLTTSSDDEEALLARALEESIQDAAEQARLHSGAATAHAGAEMRLNEHVPDSMRHISQEDAEELMLVEAIKASLLESESQKKPPPEQKVELLPNQKLPPPSQEAPAPNSKQGRKGGEKKTRMFWRKKGTSTSPKASMSR